MMTEIFALVSTYGTILVFASAFLSCLAVPIPTSLMMLTAGAFVATEDLILWHVFGAAFGGAILGDQTGFFLGKRGGRALIDKIASTEPRQKVVNKASGFIERHGGYGVFLSTWLFAPLGPWVNFVAGSAGLSWRKFTVFDTLGELIWVTVYVSLGYLFAANLSVVASKVGNLVGFLTALAVIAAMLWWIIRLVTLQHKAKSATLSER